MNAQIDRRLFGAGLTSAAALSAFASTQKVDKPQMIPVIDTHQHLWDVKKFKLPWLSTKGVLARSYTLEDYRKATVGLGISQTIYMEVDVTPDQQLDEARLVSSLCSDPSTGLGGAVVAGRPSSDNFPSHVESLLKLKGITGVRQVLHVDTTPSGYCLGVDFVRGIRLLGEKALSYDICVKHTELANSAKLIGQCPDTRFILDHCGNPDLKATNHDTWRNGLEQVAKYPNVMVKISGFLASAPGYGLWNLEQISPLIKHTLDTFGPDRVMFAGDWPVVLLASSYSEWLNAVRLLVQDRPFDQQCKLFHGNASHFYRLKI